MKSTKSFKKILVNLGEKLAELRVKKGYETLKEFTVKYDLPQIQYWRIEKGKANVTLKTLVKVLAIHNLTLQGFFSLVIEDERNI
ncbi:helix-turn-helix domain-containing protein [Fulvivirgaceae bacterium PWU4]|uniref:Helix-turn-helix domain-containing protein n=1 Tax=Chryseosolibacter histidini TaxID=2782349 RepID=A0AAP2GR15_9BACT|nr:helix-turn-helix transcriptional regulator [Chryseosolibacter histidini]MBT1699550.1 helix-turn-helix domain-containing protein [Chryseosolibacter histidini]